MFLGIPGVTVEWVALSLSSFAKGQGKNLKMQKPGYGSRWVNHERGSPSTDSRERLSPRCCRRTHDMNEELQLVLRAHPREEGRVADHLDEDAAHAPQIDGVPGG